MNPLDLNNDNPKVLGGTGAIERFIQEAKKDRFALIIPEKWEMYAWAHTSDILSKYPCTGILVRQSYSGTAFHVLRTDSFEQVCTNGIESCKDEWATFGDGVIYCYPTPAQAAACNSAFGVFRIDYGPGTLRAIYTEDKESFMQGEILVPPDCVIGWEPYMRRFPGDGRLFRV